MESPYMVLGIGADASPEQVRRAYKRLVKELHPDKHSDDPNRGRMEEHLKQVNAAYEQLQKSYAEADLRKSWKSEPQSRASAQRSTAKTSCGAAQTSAENADVAATRFWNAYHKMKQDLKRNG